MRHKTFIESRGANHGVFMIGAGEWIPYKDPYHASGAYQLVEGGQVAIIGPFTAKTPSRATKAEKHRWMVRNWFAARRAFLAIGVKAWIFKRREDDGTFTLHRVSLDGSSDPAINPLDAGEHHV